MPVELAGLWDLGFYAPITEMAQWEMVIRSFGVERLNMSPVTGIKSKYLSEFRDPDRIFISRCEGDLLEPVFIDENGDVSLDDFEHPHQALYVFGKTGRRFIARRGFGETQVPIGPVVRIDVPAQMGMLFPHEAAAIILWDRWQKERAR